ncbi:MAG TPA: hypothetical protein VMN77_06810 [Nitrospiria bacterium]|jgi:hypothetical protein|nr:hypothetical protein [Nitrospiria bacterium]
MIPWSRIKEDLYNGLSRLRSGLLTTTVYSSQEIDRLKFRYRLQSLERQLTGAYRALGKYGLSRLQEGHPDLLKEKEWLNLIQDIDAKRAEREKLIAERDAFDREETQDKT